MTQKIIMFVAGFAVATVVIKFLVPNVSSYFKKVEQIAETKTQNLPHKEAVNESNEIEKIAAENSSVESESEWIEDVQLRASRFEPVTGGKEGLKIVYSGHFPILRPGVEEPLTAYYFSDGSFIRNNLPESALFYDAFTNKAYLYSKLFGSIQEVVGYERAAISGNLEIGSKGKCSVASKSWNCLSGDETLSWERKLWGNEIVKYQIRHESQIIPFEVFFDLSFKIDKILSSHNKLFGPEAIEGTGILFKGVVKINDMVAADYWVQSVEKFENLDMPREAIDKIKTAARCSYRGNLCLPVEDK